MEQSDKAGKTASTPPRPGSGDEHGIVKARSIMDLEGILRREGQAPVTLEQMDEDTGPGSAAPRV